MHPLELWQSAVLGLVEGITEYLPISSTGHLIIAGSLMHLQGDSAGALEDFEVVIQGGAILAVVGLYWPSILKMLRGLLGKDHDGLKLLLNLFIAFLPSAILGLAANKWIDRHLFALLPVLVSMFLGGLYMIVVDLWGQGRLGATRPWQAKEKTIYEITPREALNIGLLQCLSLWPGTSRSMMTITGGMFAGLRPRQAAQFSFLLGLPTLTAATLYKLFKNLSHAHKTGGENLFEVLGPWPCIVGIAVAAISAAVAVKWLVGFLNKHGLSFFGWYRIALCITLIALTSAGIVSITKVKSQEPNPHNTQTEVIEKVTWPDATAK